MKLSIVIGASRGLGLEFVAQLRDGGSKVLGTARDDEGKRRIEALGAESWSLDVSRPEAFQDLAHHLSDHQLDLVIFNAGVFGPREGATRAPTLDEFDQVMRTNVLGLLLAIPVLAPRLSGNRGRFVAISSDMASIGGLESSLGLAYRASKAALNMVIRGAALDHPEVAFLAQSPGWVRTDMGGPEAPLDAADSVAAMLRNIRDFDHGRSGAFLALDGSSRPW